MLFVVTNALNPRAGNNPNAITAGELYVAIRVSRIDPYMP